MNEPTTATLPAYAPPNAERASLAVGFSPLIVLVAFTAVVSRLIDADTGFALLLACTAWVVYEMHVFQRGLDAYNAQYARAHLAWRSSEALAALADAEGLPAPTREFVRRFLQAGRRVLRDGERP